MEKNKLNDITDAINKIIKEKKEFEKQLGNMSKEEEIGFYKGCLNTLAKERDYLIKRIGNIEVMIESIMKKIREVEYNTEQK